MFAKDEPSRVTTIIPINDIKIDVEKKIVVVEVTTPTGGWTVHAVPTHYIQQPEWWKIEIIGTLPKGYTTQALVVHKITISIDAFKQNDTDKPYPIAGKEGIEIVGYKYVNKEFKEIKVKIGIK